MKLCANRKLHLVVSPLVTPEHQVCTIHPRLQTQCQNSQSHDGINVTYLYIYQQPSTPYDSFLIKTKNNEYNPGGVQVGLLIGYRLLSHEACKYESRLSDLLSFYQLPSLLHFPNLSFPLSFSSNLTYSRKKILQKQDLYDDEDINCLPDATR